MKRSFVLTVAICMWANQNLTFASYRMPARRNSPRFYDAKTRKPAGRPPGVLVEGAIGFNETPAVKSGEKPASTELRNQRSAGGFAVMLTMTVIGLLLLRRRRAV